VITDTVFSYYGEKNEKILQDLVRLRTSMQDYLQAELLKLSNEGRPFNRPLSYDFPEDPMTWQLAEKGLGTQNEDVPADRTPMMGDVITTVPCTADLNAAAAAASTTPAWVLQPVDASNSSAGAPMMLRLKSNTNLCVDSATLSTQCDYHRQCGAALWECDADDGSPPPAAHTWSHMPDGTLRNLRDVGFVGANGGAESGGAHCLKLTEDSAFPIAAHCSPKDNTQQWKLNSDGTLANNGKACLGTAPPKTVVGIDQYMVGDDMMVAPVLQAGARERAVYFPKGSSWKHHFTGQVYQGGATKAVPAPMETFPLFHKV